MKRSSPKSGSRSRLYIGIIARIKFGVNENTPHLYYGIGDLMAIAKRKQQQVDELRMAGLNDSRKPRVKMCAQSEPQYVLMNMGGPSQQSCRYSTDSTGPLAIGPAWIGASDRDYHKSEFHKYATTVGPYTLRGELITSEGKRAQPHLFHWKHVS